MFCQRICFQSLVAIAYFHAALPVAQAGAWLAPAGDGEIIATASFSDSTKFFDQSGRLIHAPSYRKFELSTYIEYGATDWLTIVATPSLDRIQQSPSPGMTQTTTGIGDTAIGPRLRIYQNDNLVVSVQGVVRPPLGLEPNPATQSLTHSRIWTGELRGLFGYSTQIKGFDSFADFEAGYRWNDMATPNEWRADLTLGLHATPKLLFLVQDFLSVSDGRTTANPSYYWDKAQVSVVYAFNATWSGQLGSFATVIGRNAGREVGPMAALWYRF